MTAPAAHPATPAIRPGDGALTVESVSGQSAVTSTWASSPLKILVPRPRGQSVWAFLSSFGGGLVAGDEVRLQVKLGPRTRCFLSTQASTKIYRNPQSRPCSARLSASIAADSLLVIAPDPIQSFSGSSYRQRQEFHLDPTAGLILVDWFGSGRSACGERWAFSQLESRNEIFIEGKRVFVDALSLRPNDGDVGGQHRMGRFNCVALVVVLGASVSANACHLVEQVALQPVERASSVVTSASPLRHGAVLRIAGESTEAVAAGLRRHLGFLAEKLGDDPLARKW